MSNSPRFAVAAIISMFCTGCGDSREVKDLLKTNAESMKAIQSRLDAIEAKQSSSHELTTGEVRQIADAVLSGKIASMKAEESKRQGELEKQEELIAGKARQERERQREDNKKAAWIILTEAEQERVTKLKQQLAAPDWLNMTYGDFMFLFENNNLLLVDAELIEASKRGCGPFFNYLGDVLELEHEDRIGLIRSYVSAMLLARAPKAFSLMQGQVQLRESVNESLNANSDNYLSKENNAYSTQYLKMLAVIATVASKDIRPLTQSEFTFLRNEPFAEKVFVKYVGKMKK